MTLDRFLLTKDNIKSKKYKSLYQTPTTKEKDTNFITVNVFINFIRILQRKFYLLQALIAAVNETAEEDIRDALKAQTDHHLALVPRGPKVVKDTVAYNTTVNTDDTVMNKIFL